MLGFPASIEQSARALGHHGADVPDHELRHADVAAYGVGSTILQVVMIPAMGLSMAVSTLVGQNIGAGNIERAARDRPAGRAGWASACSAAFGVIAFLFAPQLVAFFVPGDAGRDRRTARRTCASWRWRGASSARSSRYRRAARLGQHGDDDGADAGLAVGAAVPARLRAVEAHDARRARHLVGVSGHQRR